MSKHDSTTAAPEPQTLEEARQIITGLRQQIATVETERDTFEQLLKDYGEKVGVLSASLADANQRASEAQAQMTTLKAKLYDYMTAGV